jgi:hypothetical protein
MEGKPMNEAVKKIAQDCVFQIIRYGDYDPTDAVLDDVLDALLDTESAGDIYYNAINGDELLAELRIRQHDLKNLEAQKMANRREAQLLREYAADILESYSNDSWIAWEGQARPMEAYP